MGILSWIVLGAIAGWIASLIVNRAGDGVLVDIFLGIAGGLIGGWVFRAMGSTGFTGFNVWSLFVPIIRSGVLLAGPSAAPRCIICSSVDRDPTEDFRSWLLHLRRSA